jgi:hypothetical protein
MNTRAQESAPESEAVAWMTHHETPMLFVSESEAAEYCSDDEQPIPLYTRSNAKAGEVDE